MLAEQNQIVAAVLELGGERLGDGESIGGNAVDLQLHGAIGAHAHRLAQRLLDRVGPDGDDHRLAAAALFIDLERGLDGIASEVVDVELQARLVDRDARGRDPEPRLGIGRALDADGNFHRRSPHVKEFT